MNKGRDKIGTSLMQSLADGVCLQILKSVSSSQTSTLTLSMLFGIEASDQSALARKDKIEIVEIDSGKSSRNKIVRSQF